MVHPKGGRKVILRGRGKGFKSLNFKGQDESNPAL